MRERDGERELGDRERELGVPPTHTQTMTEGLSAVTSHISFCFELSTKACSVSPRY